MNSVSLFEANHYRDFINAKITTYFKVRGYRTRLAKAAGFSPSFLSQVMHETVELTPEHAIRLAQFWEMNETETEYFMLLVDHGRAGSITLRTHIKSRMEKMKSELSKHGYAVGQSNSSMFSHSMSAQA
jgi:uncharacterized protein (TIGR02147 family)